MARSGHFTYRGYGVDELGPTSSFLETAYLADLGRSAQLRIRLRAFRERMSRLHRRGELPYRDMMKCSRRTATRWMRSSRAPALSWALPIHAAPSDDPITS